MNDKRDPKEVDLGVKLKKVATVDATGISAEVFGLRAIPITNTIMLGAVSKATGWVKMESLAGPIKHLFPGKTGDVNVDACKRGYDATKVWGV